MNEGRCVWVNVCAFMNLYGICLYACIQLLYIIMNYMCMAQYNKVD